MFKLLFLVIMSISPSRAQAQSWGSGLYPTSSLCGYNATTASNRNLAQPTQQQTLESSLDDLKDKSDKLDDEISDNTEELVDLLRTSPDEKNVAAAVSDFLTNKIGSCSEFIAHYHSADCGSATPENKSEILAASTSPDESKPEKHARGEHRGPPPGDGDFGGRAPDATDGATVQANSCNNWLATNWASMYRGKEIVTSICSNSEFLATDDKGEKPHRGGGGQQCSKLVRKISKAVKDQAKLEKQADRLSEKIDRLAEKEDSHKENQSGTQVCLQCMQSQQSQTPLWWQSTMNSGQNTANAVSGYYNQNSWGGMSGQNFSQNPSVANFGYPFSQMGMYGATPAGGSAGGFGCGNSIGSVNPNFAMMNTGGLNTGLQGSGGLNSGLMYANGFASSQGNSNGGLRGYSGPGIPIGTVAPNGSIVPFSSGSILPTGINSLYSSLNQTSSGLYNSDYTGTGNLGAYNFGASNFGGVIPYSGASSSLGYIQPGVSNSIYQLNAATGTGR